MPAPLPQPLSCSFRNAEPPDEALLWEMVYLAVYVPPGQTPPPRVILALPEVARYVRGWGREDDLGTIALAATDDRPIGAAWLRRWSHDNRGYGFVDVDTPELSIAVLPGSRGRGVGTQMLQHLLARADRRFERVSLSVTIGNPARRLYDRLGFEPVPMPAGAPSITMVRQRTRPQSQ
jgi:GNAT superfamily N-acetyltransferase